MNIVDKPHLSASAMCASLTALGEDIQALESAGIDSIHIDVMDGHFVPNLTFGPDVVKAVRAATALPLHVHLMVSEPGWILAPMADAGCDVCFFHLEADRYPYRLVKRIGELGMSPGVAVNPATPIEAVAGLEVPYILVMTVEPGFAGQQWLPTGTDRVRRARSLAGPATVIGVDGNVSVANARLAAEAGASLFVCGTSVLFGADRDYRAAVRVLRSALKDDGTGPIGDAP
jgi:ribulose-phosphate 3-epimerase